MALTSCPHCTLWCKESRTHNVLCQDPLAMFAVEWMAKIVIVAHREKLSCSLFAP